MKRLIILIISIIAALNIAYSDATNEAFYFDAVVFSSDSAGKGRLDVFTLVPYQTLNFMKQRQIWGAGYKIDVSVFDSDGNKVTSEFVEKRVRADDYFVAQGGTGEFDYNQVILHMKPGKYNLRVELIDILNQKTYTRQRNVSIIDFEKYDMALSGMLLLSSIEEIDGRYKITPHVSDNISDLADGFFVFYEIYSNKEIPDTIDVVWQITEGDEVLVTGEKTRVYPKGKVSREFLRLPYPKQLKSGQFTLKLIALKKSAGDEIKEEDYLAIAQRTISKQQTVAGIVLDNLEKSIGQLIYVADDDEIDFIEEGQTEEEKADRFNDFWRERDPSPGTTRNEAFNEYYSRISYANRNFQTFMEGWKTDKGMVFVIFGPPSQVDRQRSYGDGRIYERWIYSNNREFIFVDRDGFGDFRLERPITVTEKYRYRR
jgi:GWxTD domain-containing protein